MGVLFALVPAERGSHTYEVSAAVLFLLVAGLVWWLGPRVPGGWGLDLGVALAAVIVVGAAAVAVSPQAQVLVGLTLMLYAVFAAYSRPLPRFVGLLVFMLVAYGVALAVEPLLNVVYFLVIVLLTAAVSGVVGVLVAQLKEQAITDGLTGVLNRRGLAVMSEFVRADLLRGRGPVSVVLVDIDDFKQYNDEHGHLGGDRALRQVAQQLSTGLRGSDVIARFGGDEFVILLRGAGVVEAEAVLLRMAQSAGDVRWSAGVTQWLQGQSLEEVLGQADRRLYAAKQQR